MRRIAAGLAIAALISLAYWAGSRYGFRDRGPDLSMTPPAGVLEESAELRLEEEPGDLAPGTVTVSSRKQQLMGVKLSRVERRSTTHTLRILGKVAEDETRVYAVTATVEGWITEAKAIPTWAYVKRNQLLATFYSQEYLLPGTGLTYTLTAKELREAAARDGRDPQDDGFQFFRQPGAIQAVAAGPGDGGGAG